ncbi:MAG: molybdopterin-guanine dinucleotide biosynthesis protein B [Nitrospiraceae bacterium]|nr:molybdopterin-guanine dinucleotide biosynthesis protein B [Nitrospiraceae bacterium]
MVNFSFCVLGIGGHSGAGKTTLIEKVLAELKGEGFRVGILKHASHPLSPDREGKDTDRFYRAGADFVCAHDAHQAFSRHPHGGGRLQDHLSGFPRSLDLVLVEGHKNSGLPGIWIVPGTGGQQKRGAPKHPVKKIVLRDDPRHFGTVMEYIHRELEKFHAQRTIAAGLLIGGRSLRMGTDKALLRIGGEIFAERAFRMLGGVAAKTVLLGSAELPGPLGRADRLPDVPGVSGPMAGVLSAFRWAPESVWIISAVDMPFMDREAWEWVMGQRRPGVWAVLPLLKRGAKAETMAACYEPMIFGEVESLARAGISTLQELTRHPKVITPLVPKSLAHAWKNVNTIAEWKRANRLLEEKSGAPSD